ncbi:MAG: calcium-binding protein [Microcoleaceae cyanobacterium]
MVSATSEPLFDGTVDIFNIFGPLIDDPISVGDNDSISGTPGGENGTNPGGEGVPINLFNEILGTVDDDSLNGTSGIDEIMGLAGRDSLEGRGGGDRIFGENGNDTLIGELGNDSLLGGRDEDSILGGDGRDTLWGGRSNDSLFGDDDADTLYGNQGNDCLFGGLEDDSLYGGREDDSLDGGEGDDTLLGDRGSDTLIGGSGEDLFVIAENTGGLNLSDADIITDYNPEDDDEIGLNGGLTRGQLEFSETLVGEDNPGIAIRIDEPGNEGDYLAIVLNVEEGEIEFTII